MEIKGIPVGSGHEEFYFDNPDAAVGDIEYMRGVIKFLSDLRGPGAAALRAADEKDLEEAIDRCLE